MSTATKAGTEAPQNKPTRSTVTLSAIVQDKKLWPRQTLDYERVKEFAALYKEEPEALPVILVTEHPKKPGKYLLVDGWHRAEALKTLYNDAKVPADILPKGADVFAEATRLSAISSKPLTILEKRAAVRRLLDEHGPGTKDQWSDNQIARIAGVSQPFVSSQRKALHRLAGEARDAIKKALGTPDSPTSPTRSQPEEPGINQQLWLIVQDQRADQINLAIWRDAANKYPQFKPVMRHIATVLFQASQDIPPTSAVNNVIAGSGQASAGAGADSMQRLKAYVERSKAAQAAKQKEG